MANDLIYQYLSRRSRGGREEKHFHSTYDSAEYLYFSGEEEKRELVLALVIIKIVSIIELHLICS